ncbi:MAG: Manganese transport system membrane protein MntB [Chlamydiae bacterium]|nr:Manganese transport system membrane protein MntB [Chlamydiota bacterium]
MLHFFVDPIYRAPFLGSMLMCLATGLMGSYLLVRRRTLLGETLSHAAFPGVVLSLALGALFLLPSDDRSILVILAGAFIFSFLGMFAIDRLHHKYKIHLDAAMCLVLSLFLGGGIVVASRIQFVHPLWYQQAQVFIYGQAVTMTDRHIAIYGILSLCIALFISYRFRLVELVAFDRNFAQSLGVNLRKIDLALMALTILAIVVGIRSVGVIMMAGMLIAPAVSARAFTDRLSTLMGLSALFGLLSGFGGNMLSILWSHRGFTLPTGPMILLFSVSISLLSLLFAPKKGAVVRFIRIFRFRKRCQSENILKTLWKQGVETPMNHQEILHWNPILLFRLRMALSSLKREGWLLRVPNGFLLTPDGVNRAAYLIRLHRLWELYLATCLDVDEERVHHSAEEMEHIITPELERRLTKLLNDPQHDPHQKPIPSGEL